MQRRIFRDSREKLEIIATPNLYLCGKAQRRERRKKLRKKRK